MLLLTRYASYKFTKIDFMKNLVKIQNLKCGGCAHTIVTKLSELNNISNVEVNVEDSNVSFSYKNNKDLNYVKTKLDALGYPLDGEKNSISSKAISFVSCATGKLNRN